MPDPVVKPRRGWRERIDAGLRRAHRVECPSTLDHRPGRRCKCESYELVVPGYAPGSTRTVTFHGTLADARRHRRALQGAGRPEVPAEALQPDAPANLTALAAEFLRVRGAVLSRLTIRNYEVDYRLRIAPILGALPLDQIDRRVCEQFVAQLAGEGHSHRVLKGTVRSLGAILAKGVEWWPQLLPMNPAARLQLPPEHRPEGQVAERCLTAEQLRQLIEHGSKQLRIHTMLRAAAGGGLRRGEVCALRWPDVDLPKQRINIRSGYEGPTKGRRARTITISPGFAKALGRWFNESVIEQGASATGYVWPGRGGRIMEEHTPSQACTRATVRAGLVDADGKPLITSTASGTPARPCSSPRASRSSPCPATSVTPT
jgi:site-specific recombinase XerC